MISLIYNDEVVVISDIPKNQCLIKLEPVDAFGFNKAKDSLTEDWKKITTKREHELIKWLKHIKFTGTLTEHDDYRIVVNVFQFFNGLVTSYEKFYDENKANFDISIVNGVVPETKNVVCRKGNWRIFGFREINIYDEMMKTEGKPISDFELIIWEKIFNVNADNYKGIAGFYHDTTTNFRQPLFGGENSYMMLSWYSAFGSPSMEYLQSLSKEDWDIVYMEANLFYKMKKRKN
jgi:hypothetical protein